MLHSFVVAFGAELFKLGELFLADLGIVYLQNRNVFRLVEAELVDADDRLKAGIDRAWVLAAASSMRSLGRPSSMALAMPPIFRLRRCASAFAARSCVSRST
jgi:hypothetical protein